MIITSEILNAATRCPYFFQEYLNKNQRLLEHEYLEMAFRYAARAFWQEWRITGSKPVIEFLRIQASRNLISLATLKVQDKLVAKLGRVCDTFHTNHPDVRPDIIGLPFEGFSLKCPHSSIKGSIDLIYKSRSGAQAILCITSPGDPGPRLSSVLSYIGFMLMHNEAKPFIITEYIIGHNMRQCLVSSADLDLLNETVEYVMWLTSSKNISKHWGLTCQMCQLKEVCRR